MNWMKFLRQFPVVFWASSLSLGIHGLALMIPGKTELTQPQTRPLETIGLTLLPNEIKPSNSQIQPTPIASPTSQTPNIQKSPPAETETATPDTSAVEPIEQNPVNPSPTQAGLTSPKQTNPISETPEIESSEQFATRTQIALTQVTGQIGKRYGDRFAERSDTIAASPELFFTQPELFYDKKGMARSGLDKTFQIEKETPESVFKAFEPNLQKAGFTVSPIETYAGGPLYEVKSKKEGSSERVAFYLNLLLIPDKSGTIVVIWKTRPQK